MERDDPRASVPVCTPLRVAQLVGMPRPTVYSWMRATPNRPALVHSVAAEVRGWPTIPLVGLAEAHMIRGLRNAKMPMSEITLAVDYLRGKYGEFVLASPELLHDGVSALVRSAVGIETLRSGQLAFDVVVERELQPFRLAPDTFVEAYQVRELPETEIDPRFSSGRMRFTRTGIPVFAVYGMLQSGADEEVVAREFGIDLRLVEAVSNADAAWLSEVA